MKLNLPYKSGTVRVSSPYGMRTLGGVTAMHRGVDLVGTDKTIAAPCAGRIGWAGMYDDKASGGHTWEWGNYIRLEAANGYMVYLCHMASVAVKIGQRVRTGDILGAEGSTGQSTGSHCHFEVRYGGKAVDPTPLLEIANRTGNVTLPDCGALVCQKAGLEAQTKVYLDKYKYAADLWRKLWEAIN